MNRSILLVSGSTRSLGSTQRLIHQFSVLFPGEKWTISTSIVDLPMFHPGLGVPKGLSSWKEEILNHDVVFFITPEYIFNIPAVLKNALEWITESGELMDKKVIACTYTPHEPRGEKALQSLTWSLQALSANIVLNLSLYHNHFIWEEEKIVGGEGLEMLTYALEHI